MSEFTVVIDGSPTAVHQEPVCAYCDAKPGECRVLVANPTNTVFVCDGCSSVIAAQVRDIIAKQDSQLSGDH